MFSLFHGDQEKVSYRTILRIAGRSFMHNIISMTQREHSIRRTTLIILSTRFFMFLCHIRSTSRIPRMIVYPEMAIIAMGLNIESLKLTLRHVRIDWRPTPDRTLQMLCYLCYSRYGLPNTD